jgi:hypothetical protein
MVFRGAPDGAAQARVTPTALSRVPCPGRRPRCTAAASRHPLLPSRAGTPVRAEPGATARPGWKRPLHKSDIIFTLEWI